MDENNIGQSEDNVIKDRDPGDENDARQEELEIIEEELKTEREAWDEAGMHVNMVQHENQSIFELKCKVQALINCLIRGTTDEIDFNIEIKKLVLNDLKTIRTEIEPQFREAKREMLRQQLTEGVRLNMPWEMPNGTDKRIA